MEIIDADGTHQTFVLTMSIPEHSILSFTEAGESVNATYNALDNTVTFPDVLPAGQEYSVEYYFPGAYNIDFSAMFKPEVAADVNERVTKILARLVVTVWAESKRNMLVDI